MKPKNDFKTLMAWVHWKKKEKGVSEDDLELVRSIEDLHSLVGTYRARLDQSEADSAHRYNWAMAAEAKYSKVLEKCGEYLTALKFYADGNVDHEADIRPIVTYGRNARGYISKSYGSVARETLDKWGD